MRHFIKLACLMSAILLATGVHQLFSEPVKSSGSPEAHCCFAHPSPTGTSNNSEARKVILILQARDYSVTVFSRDSEVKYAVSTEGGVALADNLSEGDLRTGFPELYDVVTGIAWAGM